MAEKKPTAEIAYNSIENKEGQKKYVVYKVCVVRQQKQWFILRRYSEFHSIYKHLRKKYPHIQLSIPPKKIFGNFDPALIKDRQIGLTNFIQSLLQHPELPSDRAVRDFLLVDDPRHQPDNDMDNPSKDTSGAGDELTNEDLGKTLNMKAKPADFNFIKVIGKGSFGRVYLAQHKEDSSIFAIKVLNKSAVKKKNEARHIMAERNVLLKNLKHPFLVGLHYSFQTKDKLYFVLDYVNGGELFFHLQKEKSFKEPRARFYAAEISSALGFLHGHSIIYRDLKPENLLLDRDGHVVITDFGLAKEGISVNQSTQTFCGTPEYLAPEVIKKRPYTFAVDWWCLGAVLYEMIYGLPPFYSRNHGTMLDRILNQKLTFKPSIDSSPECKDILTQLLQKEPDQRLGSGSHDVVDIQKHSFFLGHIDFEALLNKEVQPPWKPRFKDPSQSDTTNIDPVFLAEGVSQSVGTSGFAAGVFEADDAFQGFTYAPPVDFDET